MRTTVSQNVGNHSQATAAVVNEAINQAARELTEGHLWSYRRRETAILTTAIYKTGTVAVTTGSNVVTGSGTAWTVGMAGRAIRISGEVSYLFILSAGLGPTSLQLGDPQGNAIPWPGPTGSGLTYTIFQHQYALPADVDLVLLPTRDWPITEKSRDWFDRLDPARQSQGNPVYYALARTLYSGSPPVESTFIEFWPVPSIQQAFRLPYSAVTPTLTADADLPVCPSEPIETYATSKMADYLMAKTGDARWDTLSKTFYARLVGTQQFLGVLDNAIRDDELKYGLPTALTDGTMQIGYDILATRDWEVL